MEHHQSKSIYLAPPQNKVYTDLFSKGSRTSVSSYNDDNESPGLDYLDKDEDCRWRTHKEIDEPLPQYECTVYKRDYVIIKKEFDEYYLPSTDRRWRRALLTIRGTSVTLDYDNSRGLCYMRSLLNLNDIGTLIRGTRNQLQTLIIEGANLLPADEYSAIRPFTFRLRLASGIQYVIETTSAELGIQWVEALRSAINLAPDLDRRRDINFRLS